MRKRFTVLVISVFAVWFGVALVAQDAPPAEYVQAMQDIRAAAQTFGELGKTQDLEAAEKAAESARAAFQYVEQFWTERKDEEAARLAAAGSKAAADAFASAGALSSVAGVQYAAKQMGATCMTCHEAHRERLEDGSFVIK